MADNSRSSDSRMVVIGRSKPGGNSAGRNDGKSKTKPYDRPSSGSGSGPGSGARAGGGGIRGTWGGAGGAGQRRPLVSLRDRKILANLEAGKEALRNGSSSGVSDGKKGPEGEKRNLFVASANGNGAANGKVIAEWELPISKERNHAHCHGKGNWNGKEKGPGDGKAGRGREGWKAGPKQRFLHGVAGPAPAPAHAHAQCEEAERCTTSSSSSSSDAGASTSAIPMEMDDNNNNSQDRGKAKDPSGGEGRGRLVKPAIPAVPMLSTKAAKINQALTSAKGLRDEANPITHSDMAKRTQHYVLSTTGHQVASHVGGSAGATEWWKSRHAKLRAQAPEKETTLFHGVTVYINGYTGEKITNQELMRLININGGNVSYRPSASCTHIISSMPLSAKKAQEQLTKRRSTITKLVKPEWILDSIAKGSRLPESRYTVFENKTQASLLNMLGGGGAAVK